MPCRQRVLTPASLRVASSLTFCDFAKGAPSATFVDTSILEGGRWPSVPSASHSVPTTSLKPGPRRLTHLAMSFN